MTVRLTPSTATDPRGTSNGSTGTAGLRIALGVLLLLAGARRWRGRPTDGTAAETPGWLTAADSFTPVKSLGLGFVLATVNPKCLLLIIAAGVTISQANLDNLDTAIVAAIFMLISISTVVGPVVVFHVGGEKGAQMLARTKVWLIANNSAVMAVLLLVFGFVLIGEGIKGLS